MLSKAGSRIYILRICKFYGYSQNEFTKLFDSLILSLFYYAIEVWGSALQAKYIDKFNKFLNRAFRYGYTQNKYSMAKMIEERDRLLFNKVMHNPEHCLYELLPEKRQLPLRERDHYWTFPLITKILI